MKSKSLLTTAWTVCVGVLIFTNAARGQCDFGAQLQVENAAAVQDGGGTFSYTDPGDTDDVFAGYPLAGDCASLVSLSSAWTASLRVSLGARTLTATSDEEPYLNMGLYLLMDGSTSDYVDEVHLVLAQLNYTGHSDDSDVFAVGALFEAVKSSRTIGTTALGKGKRSSEGTSYLAFTLGTKNQPATENFGAASGLLTLSYNPANKMLTGSYNGKPFGEISLGVFGADASPNLAVAGASGGGAEIDDGAEADSLLVSVPPPTFTVTAPANNAVVAAAPPVVTLRGAFKDTSGVSGVWCAVNGDTNGAVEVDTLLAAGADPGTAPQSGNWSGSLDLSQSPGAAPGPNILTLWAVNTKGVSSGAVTRTVNWSLTTKLSLGVAPSASAGKVHGLADKQTLLVGKTYAVAAVPNNGWAFWKWTDANGNSLGTNAAFDYTPSVSPADADQGVFLNANFVANPFPLAAGSYDGLFSVPGNLTASNAGYFNITVANNGAFSGSVLLGSRVAHAISGQFDLATQFETGDPTATASAVAVLNKTNALGLTFALSGLTNGVGAGLNGVVNLYSIPEKRFVWPTSARVDAKIVSAKNDFTTGLYNFVLPPISAAPANGPSGWSYGAATLGKNGAVTVVLTLADGVTPVTSFGTGVAADGSFPVYVPLYGGAGLLFGWMQFPAAGNPIQYQGVSLDLAGTNLSWFASAAKYYPGGFASDPASFFVIGSRYVVPKGGANIFGFSILAYEIDQQLNDMSEAALSFNPKSGALSVIGANPAHLTLHFSAATGAVTGSEVIGGKPITIKGVLLPPFSTAYGFYIGNGKTDVATGQSGPIEIFGPGAAPGDR